MSALKNALILAHLEVPVFPCSENKRPAIFGGNGFRDASCDTGEVEALWANGNGSLVGVPTGAVSGIDAIDIDPRNGGNEWETSNMAWLSKARIHETGSGGRHYLFRHAPGIKMKNGLAPGVDLRGDGGYIIWWPASGKPIPSDIELPDWPEEGLSKVIIAERTAVASACAQKPVKKIHEGGTAYGLEGLSRECNAIRTAPEGQKHSTLNKAAYSVGGLVAANELDEGVALSELKSALSDIRDRCKDFRSATATLTRAFEEGLSRPRHVDKIELVDDGTDWAPILKRLQVQEDAGVELPMPEPQKNKIPPGLMDVDGFLADFISYVTRTAIRPQPFAALAAGIALVGALAGRRYQTASQRPAWSNFYTATLIDSGGGKEHARTIIKKLLYRSGLDSYLGGEDIASGTALHTSLERHPVRLFLIDECGDFLRGVLGTKASAHKQQIAQKLKTLYTSAGDIVLGTEYADQSEKGRKRSDLHNPVACIYGTSTPQQWWDAVAGASLSDGLMGRFLLFVPEENYPAAQTQSEFEDIPQSLIEGAQRIAAGTKIHNPKDLLNLVASGNEADPYNVPLTLQAIKRLKEVQDRQDMLLRENEGTYKTSLVSRIVENTMKLALVRAVSRNADTPLIGETDIEWGKQISLHCFETMMSGAERYASENEGQAIMKDVLNTIRRLGEATPRQIMRALGMKISIKERDEALSALVEGGWIVARKKEQEKAGRPTYLYSVLK